MGKLLRDETFVAAMNKQNALLEVLAADKLQQMSGNWAEVATLVRAGYAEYVYDFGDQFKDKWIDTASSNKEYANYNWHVAHFGNYSLQDGETVPGMTIQAHYAHPFGVQFSHQRAFLKCDTELAVGDYYFVIETKWGNNVAAGDIVSFTLTKPVPAGGRISGCYGAPDQAKANWRIYTWAADGKTKVEDSITPTFTATGTNLGTMKLDKRNGNLNSCQEMAYGWNRWKTSALRQYLNSSATKGNWWVAQDEWDIAPDELASRDGFLTGMPADLLDAIKPVKIVTYPNTVNDDIAGNTPDVTYDKVFLPALEQIYVKPQKAGEGDAWEYWKRVAGTTTPLAQWGTYPQMITYAVENTSSAQVVRLRSANRGDAHVTWYVHSSGTVYNYGYGASNSVRFAPACVIC